jgi:allantoin racemase
MRLLIINPNTTPAMTAKVREAAAAALPAHVLIEAVSGRFGPRYIASRAAFAVASHAALDAFAAHGRHADAVLLACFGDPGLDALREASCVPVIGLVEASVEAAMAQATRFSVVTGGQLWEPMLRESLLVRGLGRHLASIRTVAPDGGMIARDPAGAAALLGEACDACVREDGAGAVVLGGVGLIGIAESLQPGRSYPVICSVTAGLNATQLALSTGTRAPAGLGRAAPVGSIGLSPELESLFLAPPPDRD